MLDHRRNPIVIDSTGSTQTRLVIKTLDPILQEPAPPFADGVLMHAEVCANSFARKPICAAQDDTAAL